MGEVITAKDKEYEAEERATAPGANQSMSDRVNNRSLRPQSAAFKEFMKSGWADDDPEINPLESSKFTPARLEALGKAFPGERLVIPAGQPKVRNNDCDYMFRPDTTFAYYTGLGSDYEAGAVLVLNPVDPDSPEAAAGKTHTPELFVAPRADNSTEDFFMSAHYGEYWVGPRAGLKEMQAMTGIETHDIAQLADALSKDVGAEAGAVRVRVVSETNPQITSMVESIREANGFADPDKNSASDDKLHEFAAEARMVKDGYEINEMRKAVDATKHGFDRLLSALPAALDKPRSERILEGAFNAVSRELGNAVGYDSIVASGPHAPILHWMRNTGVVKTGDMLLSLIERRLDNVVYRLGFAMTRREARQLVNHAHFTVNGHKVNIPSYLVRVGDVIEVKEGSRSSVAFKRLTAEDAPMVTVPKWLERDKTALKGTVVTLPAREDIDMPIEEHLIVELYSK